MADDASTSSSPADVLSTFLATSPTLVQDKLTSVFDNLHLYNVELVQFWAPIKTTGGRWLLTTSDQPFAITKHYDGIDKYRLCSVRYKYNIDVENLEIEEDPTIISGAPARAFLNRMPELLPDLSAAHRMTPLETSAVQCGLARFVMLPIFDPSESCSVGVVECCSRSFYQLDYMLNDLSIAFEKEGLKTFRTRPPDQIVCSLQRSRNEIDEALKIIWPKFHLDLVQVWIAYKDDDHDEFSSSTDFSSSMEDSKRKRILGFKLTDRCSVDDLCENDYVFEDYSSICNKLPLKHGEGLIGKTLISYEPRFIKRISKLSDNQPLMTVRYSCWGEGDPFECSCFVICLRSSEFNDLDYVFEFLWHEVPNHAILLESLLLALKKCLPNFKYSSGAELGDELSIIDVGECTEYKVEYVKIFKGNRSSSASEALENRSSVVKERLTLLEAKCKTTPISLSEEGMIEAAKTLYVSLSTLKRKRKDQSDTNEEDKGAFQDPSANNKEMCLVENNLTIKAEYADDMIKFHLPISSATFAAIEKEIGEGLKLNPANYKIKYLDEDGDWILMTSDKDVRVCIKDLRNVNNIVRMRLLPGQLSDPSHTYQVT